MLYYGHAIAGVAADNVHIAREALEHYFKQDDTTVTKKAHSETQAETS